MNIDSWILEASSARMGVDPWLFGWGEVFSALNSFSILAAAGVGYWGVRTWKQERIDTRRIEVAEDALSLIYQAKEVFDDIRNPLSFAGEGSTRPRFPDDEEGSETTIQRDGKYVPRSRIEKHTQFFEKCISIRPVLKVYFGDEAVESMIGVVRVRNRIYHAATQYYREANEERVFANEAQREQYYKRQAKIDSTIWNSGEADDEINKNMNDLINMLEAILLPFLGKKIQND